MAERLGYTPGGALDLRCRMMRDRAAASVWVLVVDGLEDGRHVSLHPTRGAACDHADMIIPTEDVAADAVVATVAQRAIGSSQGPVEIIRQRQAPAAAASDG
ncbi:hypothetical protein [Amycolatopsis sp. cmx-4-83]|uniref:hypothetical protein n=1 Tax=Amycolatopsis sp. cmx-4-83 TaxID=2790940 RepID=UPI00397A5022